MHTCRWRRRAASCSLSSVICVRSTTCIVSAWRRSSVCFRELCTTNRSAFAALHIYCFVVTHQFYTFLHYMHGLKMQVGYEEFVNSSQCLVIFLTWYKRHRNGYYVICRIMSLTVNCSYLLSRLNIYADDTKLYRHILKSDDQSSLQQDIDTVKTWADRRLLKLNVNKCKVVTYALRDSINTSYFIQEGSMYRELEKLESFKDLQLFIIIGLPSVIICMKRLIKLTVY